MRNAAAGGGGATEPVLRPCGRRLPGACVRPVQCALALQRQPACDTTARTALATPLSARWLPAAAAPLLPPQVEVTLLLLGILATRAEPALSVLGSEVMARARACTHLVPNGPYSPYAPHTPHMNHTIIIDTVLYAPRTHRIHTQVEALSGGAFTRALLVRAVALGVGAGMAVGAAKILFGGCSCGWCRHGALQQRMHHSGRGGCAAASSATSCVLPHAVQAFPSSTSS